MRYTQYYKMRIPEGPDYYDVEDFNNNTMTIDTELNRLKNMITRNSIEHTVILSSQSWSNATYQVSVPDVTQDSIVIMGIAMNVTAEQMDAIINAKINAIAQSNGTVTVKAFGTVPSIDIALSFVVS